MPSGLTLATLPVNTSWVTELLRPLKSQRFRGSADQFRQPQRGRVHFRGTESVNLAVKGVAWAKAEKGKHIVTSNIEHNAVLRSLRRLKMMDYKVSSVPVDSHGRVNPSDVAKSD